MNYIGIDIGSTASKVVVLGDESQRFVIPTGWNSKETINKIKEILYKNNVDIESKDSKVVATGYGRISVDFADKIMTEITCHAVGGKEIAKCDCTIIDIGGQDTKVIVVEDGLLSDFIMNDKCSAGTGKFIEIMSNRLAVTIEELFSMASQGEALSISSLCTVFAESEIISFMGKGAKKEDIAAGVIDSVASKVASLSSKKQLSDKIILTGGLSNNVYFADLLSKKLQHKVEATADGRYAGALGAALLAKNI